MDETPALPWTPQPEASLGYRLWMVRHAWTRRADAALAPTGLTHMQFFVLNAIRRTARDGDAPSQAGLADFLRVDPMTVSKVVRTLEAKAMLRRAAHPRDPRANSVALTAAGDAVLDAATPQVFAEHDRFFGRLGPTATAEFGAMLTRLLDDTCPHGAAPDTEQA